jgi:ADP-ribose pyrophosphatase YjhB (NUDIX family)
MEKQGRIDFAVFGYLFNSDYSKILLIRRNKEKRERWGFDWGIPGGKGEWKEDSKEAIIREVFEETGINLKNPKFCLYREHINEEKASHSIHFLFSEIISENEKVTLNSESDAYEWFEIEDLPDKMLDSKEHIQEIIKQSKK